MDRYGYDLSGGSTGLTPVYALVPGFHDPRDGYARDLLAVRCLQGVVTYVPEKPDESSPYLDLRTGQPVFEVTIAQAWGYSAQRLNPLPKSAVPTGVDITPAIQRAMAACGKKSDKRLGLAPERLPNDIEAGPGLRAGGRVHPLHWPKTPPQSRPRPAASTVT